MISQIQADIIKSNTVIYLIPEAITLSPIYKDALLYKTARDYGIDVHGAEDNNLQNNKKDNQERETNMVENIKNTANKGHDVIYIMGKTI